MHVFYECVAEQKNNEISILEELSAYQSFGHYERSLTINFSATCFSDQNLKALFFKLNEKDYTDNQIKSELENENLDLLGYAALVIDELKLQKVDFQMHKNETQ